MTVYAGSDPAVPFTVVVLAGDREPGEGVAAAAGVAAKCLAPVGGQPMVLRVLQALAQTPEVDRRILVGPRAEARDSQPELKALVETGAVDWMPPGSSPSTSLLAALDQIPAGQPVLVTTADHALLTPALLDEFCARARATEADAVAGIARQETISAVFPAMERTALRFRDGAFCGCNLFALLTDRGRTVIGFWREMEAHRKRPWRLAQVLGPGILLRFLIGRLELPDAVGRLAKHTGTRLATVELEDPTAALDVDRPEHWYRLRDNP